MSSLERKNPEIELEILEAKRLLKKAAWWGVEGSPQQESLEDGRVYFRQQNKAAMYKMISDARRKRVKEWVDIFAPIISVILSIIALIVSIIAINK